MPKILKADVECSGECSEGYPYNGFFNVRDEDTLAPICFICGKPQKIPLGIKRMPREATPEEFEEYKKCLKS